MSDETQESEPTTDDMSETEMLGIIGDFADQLTEAVRGLDLIRCALRIDSDCEPTDLAKVANRMVKALLATADREQQLRDVFEEIAEAIGVSAEPGAVVERILCLVEAERAIAPTEPVPVQPFTPDEVAAQ